MDTAPIFLKLGGSLITDKRMPRTARPVVIARLVGEIAAAHRADTELRLVLGHGSGSFGHFSGQKHGTRRGVSTEAGWLGFVEVWQDAWTLNRLVMDALATARLPAIALAPVSAVVAQDGAVARWDLGPIRDCLDAGLIPVIYGDVIFDLTRGGTILSTEDLFSHLARHLKPSRLLLAGIEAGVWRDYPANTKLIPAITPSNLAEVEPFLSGSAGMDVTGGMAEKVHQALELAQQNPGLEIFIFSGLQEGAVLRALQGEAVGTRVSLTAI